MKLKFHTNTPAEFLDASKLRGTPLSAGHDLRIARFLSVECAEDAHPDRPPARCTNECTEAARAIRLDPGDRCEVEFHMSVDMASDMFQAGMPPPDKDGNTSLAALILPRSGLGTRGLTLANGTGLIDADYNKPLRGVLVNTGLDTIPINLWDRVAQLVFTLVYLPEFEVVDDLEDSGRGGFGSTGVA